MNYISKFYVVPTERALKDRLRELRADFSIHEGAYGLRYINRLWRYPYTTAIAINHSRRQPDLKILTIICASKSEAKRLIYPSTNKDRGISRYIIKQGRTVREKYFEFAGSMEEAKYIINRKYTYFLDYARNPDSQGQHAEIDWIDDQLSRLPADRWPILLTDFFGVNMDKIHFAILTREEASTLVHIDKPRSAYREALRRI